MCMYIPERNAIVGGDAGGGEAEVLASSLFGTTPAEAKAYMTRRIIALDPYLNR